MNALTALLRDPAESQAHRASHRALLALTVAAAFTYGAFMGARDGRWLQALYSGTKVPLLLAVATLLCLPSLFVANAALGLRADFRRALYGVAMSQGSVAVTLASLAPVTQVSYLSVRAYGFALLLNGLMFALASLVGQVVLARHYRPLIARNPRHRFMLRGWLLLYWGVAIQAAWMLRPFIGAARLPTRFLRAASWDNAYVEIGSRLWVWLTGEW
ncbi:MAG: hypothetical protein AAF628_14410 [Planctomycetota bacterium]